MRQIRSIDHLRGAAALAVVAFHLTQRLGHPLVVGAAGVDIFFVISGFIMWATTAGQKVPPSRFLAHRSLRIVPLYWLVTLGMVGLALVVPGALPRLHPTLGHVVASLLFLPHLAPDGTTFPVLVPGWTLCYEALFYALFAGGLMVAERRRFAVVGAVLAVLVMAGLLLRPSQPAAAAYTSPLLLEFVAGMALAILWRRGTLPGAAIGRVLLVTGVLALLGLELGRVYSEAWRPLLWGVPAVLIVGGALSADFAGWPILDRLGAASYSLYLVHPPLVGAVLSATKRLPMLASGGICLLAVIGLGLLCHRFVERPMTERLRRLIDHRRD